MTIRLTDDRSMEAATNDEPADITPSQLESPLFRLPAELRNAIYEMALTATSVLELEPWRTRATAPTQPPLTRTCRAIRAEALPIFYSSNDFLAAICDVEDEKRLQHWLAAMGSYNRVHLTHVLVRRWEYFAFVASVEGFRRPRSRFLRWLKYSGEKDIESGVYFVVKLSCLTFDD